MASGYPRAGRAQCADRLDGEWRPEVVGGEVQHGLEGVAGELVGERSMPSRSSSRPLLAVSGGHPRRCILPMLVGVIYLLLPFALALPFNRAKVSLNMFQSCEGSCGVFDPWLPRATRDVAAADADVMPN